MQFYRSEAHLGSYHYESLEDEDKNNMVAHMEGKIFHGIGEQLKKDKKFFLETKSDYAGTDFHVAVLAFPMSDYIRLRELISFLEHSDVKSKLINLLDTNVPKEEEKYNTNI